MKTINRELRIADRISADLTYITEPSDAQKIIIGAHGFLGCKDSIFWPFAARHCAEHGIPFLKFNFSLNGIGPDKYNITELDDFRQNTIAQELNDIQTVVDYCVTELRIPHTGIYLFGHSLGAFVSLIYILSGGPAQAVIAFAPPLHILSKLKEEMVREDPDGIVLYSEGLEAELKIGTAFLKDYETNAEKYDILKNISKLSMPLKLIHFKDDRTVSYEESKKIYNAAPKDFVTLDIFNGGSHSLIQDDGKLDLRNIERLLEVVCKI